jgi:hypothetical protein
VLYWYFFQVGDLDYFSSCVSQGTVQYRALVLIPVPYMYYTQEHRAVGRLYCSYSMHVLNKGRRTGTALHHKVQGHIIIRNISYTLYIYIYIYIYIYCIISVPLIQGGTENNVGSEEAN